MRFTLLGDLLDEPEDTTAGLIEGRLPIAAFLCSPANPRRARAPSRRSARRCAVTSGQWGLAMMRTCGSSSRPLQRMGSASSGRPPSASGPYSSSWTLLRFVRVRDANDYAVVTAALEPLVSLAREAGAHVLAVHHEGKVTRDGGDGIIGYRFLRSRGYGPSPAAVREVPNALHDSAIRRRPGGDDPRAPPRDPLGIGWEWACLVRDDCAPRTQGGWQRTSRGGG